MIGVVCRSNGRYGLLTDNGSYREYDPVEMTNVVESMISPVSDEGDIYYVQDLGIVGPAIHKMIIEDGYHDYTEQSEGSARRIPKGGYCYLIGAELYTWYGLTIKSWGGTISYIYSLDNVNGGLSNVDFLKNYDGMTGKLEYICNANMKIISELTSYNGGKSPMTISSCAWHNWTERTMVYDRNDVYPDMSKLDCDLYGTTVDEYVRKSFHGGWVYCNTTPIVHHGGITLDVNSLYPYICKTRKFPVGKPEFWVGQMTEYMREEIEAGRGMSFVHIACRFTIRDGYLPFIQIHGDYMRRGVRSTSKVVNSAGEIDESVELCLTDEEYALFLQHYDVDELKIFDGAFYHVVRGVFNEYVDEYYAGKSNAKRRGDDVMTRVYKLMLNGLSGNFAKKRIRSNAILNSDGEVVSEVKGETAAKSLVHIGSCITSWARCMMVRLAQENLGRFLYCDTDSLHLSGSEPPAKIDIGGALGQMKIEREWKRAIFYGEKIYMDEDYNGHWKVVYAGIPHEVRAVMEENLDGMSRLESIVGQLDDEDVARMMNGMEVGYSTEVPNGTFSPDVIRGVWTIKTRAADERKRTQRRRLSRGNRNSKEQQQRSIKAAKFIMSELDKCSEG